MPLSLEPIALLCRRPNSMGSEGGPSLSTHPQTLPRPIVSATLRYYQSPNCREIISSKPLGGAQPNMTASNRPCVSWGTSAAPGAGSGRCLLGVRSVELFRRIEIAYSLRVIKTEGRQCQPR